MMKFFLISGILLSGLSVALGAFGAHGLKSKLSSEMLTVFEVGVRYQMYHGLALCMTALMLRELTSTWITGAGLGFFLGTVIFSGSLYLLSTTGVKWWGAVTPVGGVILLLGWTCLAVGALSSVNS